MDGTMLKKHQIKNYIVYYRNEEEFKWIYKEKFVENELDFELTTDKPYILDCGAHIGLAVVYYKIKYPNAKIVCFEPNPQDFELLNYNIKVNKIKDVKTINAAVTDHDGKTDFYVDVNEEVPWSIGDSIIYKLETLSRNVQAKKITVPAVRLSSYLGGKVDILKLDIEGAEWMVLNEAKDKLNNVRHMVVDYHGTPIVNPDNKLESILGILEHAGFNYELFQGYKIKDVVKEMKDSKLEDSMFKSKQSKKLEELERDNNYRLTIKAYTIKDLVQTGVGDDIDHAEYNDEDQ